MYSDETRKPQAVVAEPVFFYRYEDVQYAAPSDEWGESYGPGDLRVHLRQFKVLRYTPKGTWINAGGGSRFVLTKANKRYACPTIDEAKVSFLARKKKQVSIYRARAERAEKAIRIVTRNELAFGLGE